jgi:hypothetical protein
MWPFYRTAVCEEAKEEAPEPVAAEAAPEVPEEVAEPEPVRARTGDTRAGAPLARQQP